jgi:hypothetical protein
MALGSSAKPAAKQDASMDPALGEGQGLRAALAWRHPEQLPAFCVTI